MNKASSPQEVWRHHFILMLPELHSGERLLAQDWIGRDVLKYRVIWEGCKAIEKKLSSCLTELDGMAGTW